MSSRGISHKLQRKFDGLSCMVSLQLIFGHSNANLLFHRKQAEEWRMSILLFPCTSYLTPR